MGGTKADRSVDATPDNDERARTHPTHGDYTKERREIFADLALEDLIASIRQKETGSAGDQ
ncbi:MAG TPA: hypothetical protein VEO54_00510 [Thermoanaerobaculia bacterium]|nr:hypothetical protein [Thermoanaerobaculia bacterium]